MKRFSLLILIVLILLCSTVMSFAHSGGTDYKGGHYDSFGDYHYHHGYPAHDHIDGECPYDFKDNTNYSGSASFSSDDYCRSQWKSATKNLNDTLTKLNETKQKLNNQRNIIMLLGIATFTLSVSLFIFISKFRKNKNSFFETQKKYKEQLNENQKLKNNFDELSAAFAKKSKALTESEVERLRTAERNDFLEEKLSLLEKSTQDRDNSLIELFCDLLTQNFGITLLWDESNDEIEDFFSKAFSLLQTGVSQKPPAPYENESTSKYSVQFTEHIIQTYTKKGYSVAEVKNSEDTKSKYLIARNDTNTLLIQCTGTDDEYLSEYAILALHLYSLKLQLYNNENLSPVALTNSRFSPIAKKTAIHLHIVFKDDIDFEKY